MSTVKILGIIIGILLILSGGTFTLQGLGLAGGGSPMDNNPTWIYIGSFMLLIGIVLIGYAAFMRASKARQPVLP